MRPYAGTLLALLVLAGCAPEWRTIPPEAKHEYERPVPLSADARAAVESRIASTWVAIRTADRVLALESSGDGFLLRSEGGDRGQGRAVCIAADGYFLTARHCLGTSGAPPWLIHREGGGWRARRARLVWKDDEADLALLATDADASNLVLNPSAAPPAVGDVVIAGGFESNSAGTVLRCWPELGAPERNYRLVLHTAPGAGGDSGGPLLDTDGHLVGITTRGGITAGGQIEIWAVRFDPRVLDGILDSLRRAAPAPAPEPPTR